MTGSVRPHDEVISFEEMTSARPRRVLGRLRAATPTNGAGTGRIRRLRQWLTVARAISLIAAVLGPGAVVATIWRATVDTGAAREVVRDAVSDGVRAEVRDRTRAVRDGASQVSEGWQACPSCTVGERLRDAWDAAVVGSGGSAP